MRKYKMPALDIEVIPTRFGYTITVNKEVILECLSEEEAGQVTIAELFRYYSEALGE